MRDLLFLPYRAAADVLAGAVYKTFEAGTELIRVSEDAGHTTAPGKSYGWYSPAKYTPVWPGWGRMESYINNVKKNAVPRIYKYVTNESMTLLDMGDLETIRALREYASLRALVDKVFPIVGNEVRRQSDLADDKALVDALLGEGLISAGGIRGWFHEEMRNKTGALLTELSEFVIVEPPVNHRSAVAPSSPTVPMSPAVPPEWLANPSLSPKSPAPESNRPRDMSAARSLLF
jgi:hypothetical protein